MTRPGNRPFLIPGSTMSQPSSYRFLGRIEEMDTEDCRNFVINLYQLMDLICAN